MGFILKKGTRDWSNGEMKYYISDDFNVHARTNINAAFELWERNTNWNFTFLNNREIKPKGGYVIFRLKSGNSNSDIGNLGIGQIIFLSTNNVTLTTIMHEIGHAMGILHEQTRPDRDSFLHVFESRIEDSINVNINNSRKYKTVGDYDFTSIMHYSENASIKKFKKNWGIGWNIARFYEINNNGFFFLLKEDTGIVHTHKVADKGRIRGRLEQKDWSSGLSQAEFFKVDGKTFLFLIKASDGAVSIFDMGNDGTIGQKIQRKNWASGWTTARFYTIGNKTFLFLLNASTGAVIIHKMNNNGTIGRKIQTENWSSGWTNAEFYHIGNRIFLFLLKTSSGIVHVHEMNVSGTIGHEIDQKNWSSGWSTTKFYEINGDMFLLLLKERNGHIHIQRMNDDGTIGGELIRYNWDAGWSNVEIYPHGSKKFLFLINETNGNMELHAMHDSDEHHGKLSGLLNWVDGPTMEIREDIGIPNMEREELQRNLGKAEELSAGDIAAANERIA